MYIGGMFQRSANKLGPLLCRDTYEELDLPHLGAAASLMADLVSPKVTKHDKLQSISVILKGSKLVKYDKSLVESWFQGVHHVGFFLLEEVNERFQLAAVVLFLFPSGALLKSILGLSLHTALFH